MLDALTARHIRPCLHRRQRAMRLGMVAALLLGWFASAGESAGRADTLTIQGSSTASSTLLVPNQATIEAISGQSLKIVSIRSDIGLLRLLAGQSEFAVISTSLRQAIESLRPNSPDLPYDRLVVFPVSQL